MRELANNKNMTIHSNLSDISLMLRGDEHFLADISAPILSRMQLDIHPRIQQYI